MAETLKVARLVDSHTERSYKLYSTLEREKFSGISQNPVGGAVNNKSCAIVVGIVGMIPGFEDGAGESRGFACLLYITQ